MLNQKMRSEVINFAHAGLMLEACLHLLNIVIKAEIIAHEMCIWKSLRWPIRILDSCIAIGIDFFILSVCKVALFFGKFWHFSTWKERQNFLYEIENWQKDNCFCKTYRTIIGKYHGIFFGWKSRYKGKSFLLLMF